MKGNKKERGREMSERGRGRKVSREMQ